MKLSDEELAELDRLDREASPAPWKATTREDKSVSNRLCAVGAEVDGTDYSLVISPLFYPRARVDFTLIEKARNALPTLLEQIRRLQEERNAAYDQYSSLLVELGILKQEAGVMNRRNRAYILSYRLQVLEDVERMSASPRMSLARLKTEDAALFAEVVRDVLDLAETDRAEFARRLHTDESTLKRWIRGISIPIAAVRPQIYSALNAELERYIASCTEALKDGQTLAFRAGAELMRDTAANFVARQALAETDSDAEACKLMYIAASIRAMPNGLEPEIPSDA